MRQNIYDPSTIIQSPSMSKWKKIELAIRDNLQVFENGRKFCAYCGLNEISEEENSTNPQKCLIMGRCYGCQMVYYCSQEHQHLDWLDNHMPKCAELEWVALGELIQSIPASPALTIPGMHWPEGYVPQTWTDWFSVRDDLVQIAKQTAIKLEKNCFSASQKHNQINIILNKLNRREPTVTDLVDGLLAAVTDAMTYALTIGNSLKRVNIDPGEKPVCIHLLHPPNDLTEDLTFLIQSMFNSNSLDQISTGLVKEHIDHSSVNQSVKKRFHELINMYPKNKGFEIVLISNHTFLDKCNGVDWSKLLNRPFMKTEMHKSLPLHERDLYVSGWQGSYSNYIRYACQIEGYALPDLVVSFHPSFTSSPQKLINDWTDDLKVILNSNFPCLLTFSDREEKQKAFNVLNAFQSNFVGVESNQFSSLMLKQMQTKPNHVYAANSFFIIINGFDTDGSDPRYAQQVLANESTKRTKSINEILSNHHHHHNQPNTDKYDHTAYYQQNDACIQTLGLEEPTNSSLRQVKGRLQINKIASESDRTSQYYDKHQSNSYLSNTNKCNQIKMISANHLAEYDFNGPPPRAPQKKQRSFSSQLKSTSTYDKPIHSNGPNLYDQLDREKSEPNNSYFTKPTPIPPPFDLNNMEILPRINTYDSLMCQESNSSIRFADDSSVCGSEITLSDESVKTFNNAPIRPRRSSLPSASINCPPTAVLIDNTQELVAEPVAPAAKPRVNLTSDTTKATDSNNYKDTGKSQAYTESNGYDKIMNDNVNIRNDVMDNCKDTKNSYRNTKNNQDILDKLVKTQIPVTKPRAMKPTRLSDKFMNNSKKIVNHVESKPIDQIELKRTSSQSTVENSQSKPFDRINSSIEKIDSTKAIDEISIDHKHIESLSPDPQLDQNNPLPKPRNSVSVISTKAPDPSITTEPIEEDKLNKFSNELTDSGHQSSETDLITNYDHISKPSDLVNPSIGLTYFKTNLVKTNLTKPETKPTNCNENKLTNFLKNRRTSSSSSSPSSSSSILSSSSSPRSEQTSSLSQAIVSCSSISSTASSTQQSPSKRKPETTSGIVSQMKNIFELNTQNQTSLAPISEGKPNKLILKRNDSSPTEATSTPGTPTKPVVEESEYMNVSNKYLNYLRSKQNGREFPDPPETLPPPVPQSPPLPTSSPPSLSPETIQKNISPFKTQPTTDNLVAKLISKPPEAPGIKNRDYSPEIEDIETITTVTQTTTTQVVQSSSNRNKPASNRLLSSSSSNEFRIMSSNTNQIGSDRSSISGRSLGSVSQSNVSIQQLPQQKMLNHIPNSVDVINFKYEGQRQIVVPGYMTSADILRNMLLKQNEDVINGASSIIIKQQQQSMSLKEKLQIQNRESMNGQFQQQQSRGQSMRYVGNGQHQQAIENGKIHKRMSYNNDDQSLVRRDLQLKNSHPPVSEPFMQQPLSTTLDDDDLDRKFSKNNRTRSLSGVVTLVKSNDLIEIDLDIDSDHEQPISDLPMLSKPVEQYSTVHKIDDIMSPLNSEPSTPIIDRAGKPLSNQYQPKPEQSIPSIDRTKKPFVNQYRPKLDQQIPSIDQTTNSYVDQHPQSSKQPISSIETTTTTPFINQYSSNKINKKTDIVSLPYDNKSATKNSLRISQIINDTADSKPIRQNSSRLSSKRQNSFINRNNLEQGVTGSFDASDFDSFDEDEDGNRSYRPSISSMQSSMERPVPVSLEPMEKIREEALMQQKIEEELVKQEQNMAQFDPDDFDSFDEEEEQQRSMRMMKENFQEVLPMIELPEEAVSEDLNIENENKLEVEAMRRQNEFISNRNRIEAMFKNNCSGYEAPLVKCVEQLPEIKPEPVEIQNEPVTSAPDQFDYENDQPDSPYHVEESPLPSVQYNTEYPTIQVAPCNYQTPKATQSGGFFRSALDRMSGRSKSKNSKSRSSSVPMRKYMMDNEMPDELFNEQVLPNKSGGNMANMKTLQLMNKMQSDLEEKNKRKKHRRDQEQRQLMKKNNQLSKSTTEISNNTKQSPTKTPTTDRKFLSSIMNTLFSSQPSDGADAAMQKNEAKRLSLRKLKAKDKQKKKDYEYFGEENDCGGEEEQNVYELKTGDFVTSDHDEQFRKSNRSLNFQPMSEEYENRNDQTNFRKDTQGFQPNIHLGGEYEVNPSHNIDHIQAKIPNQNLNDQFNRSTSFDSGSALSKLPQFKPNSIGTTSIGTRKFGKIKNETLTDEPLNDNKKENIMKQLKYELDEEAKDRRATEHKQNILNGTYDPDNYEHHRKSTAFEEIQCDEESNRSTTLNRKNTKEKDSSKSSGSGNRKIRSKSVTFLDEISSTDDDSRQNSNLIQVDQNPGNNFQRNSSQAPTYQPRASIRQNYENRFKQQMQNSAPNESLVTPSTARKISLKTGDARLMCGALTGAGPIRSIMKKSATDLSISLNSPIVGQHTRARYEEKPVVQSQMDIEELSDGNYGGQQKYTKPRMSQSQSGINGVRRKEIMQSDL